MVQAKINQAQFKELLAEKIRRQNLALRQYRPRPEQMPFHLSAASERLIRGGNRSGKTVAAATEVAAAATGIPLTGLDGEPIPFRYPKNHPLLIWVVGYDEKHIARIYKKLFTPGLFKIIKDKDTGLWRAWQPWKPDDAAREDETKPSPPLIPGGPNCHPSGMIAEWGWDTRATRVFTVCRLKNGTEIHAFTSGGEAGVGEAVDIVWIDEDIKIQENVEEWQARLSDNRGCMIWSSWPKKGNEALRRMTLRAIEQQDRKNPDVAEWILSFSANPYIPSDEKRKRLEGWAAAGEAVVRARDLGEYVDDFQLVFPDFDNDLHGMPRKAGPDAVEEALAKNNWEIPDDWTRYLGVDPGHAHAAAIFVAVPPPSIGKFAVVYDEVYTERCNAEIQAELIAQKAGKHVFQAFIIDAHAGRQSTLGSGKRVVEFYREAFEQYKLKSQLTDSGFMGGSDNISARNMVVRAWMFPRADGTTMLRLVTDKTPYLRREFSLYKKKITRDDISDEVKSKDNHLCDSLAYVGAYLAPLFDYDAAYVPPPPPQQVVRRTLYERLMGADKNKNDTFHLGAGVVPTASALTT